MTIEYVYGNILDAEVEVLVNPVNCQGVMGKGLAVQFKQKYPGMFHEYKRLCDQGWYKPGEIFMYLVPSSMMPRYIMCAATKAEWRQPSTPATIFACVNNIYNLIIKYGIQSIAIPALGCGEGGLSWEGCVQEIIYEGLKCFDQVRILVYPPHTAERGSVTIPSGPALERV